MEGTKLPCAGETRESRDASLLLLHALHVLGAARPLFECVKWRQSHVHLEKQQLIICGTL